MRVSVSFGADQDVLELQARAEGPGQELGDARHALHPTEEVLGVAYEAWRVHVGQTVDVQDGLLTPVR